MSDLSATNCGCGCERNERGKNNFSCIWIILLLLCCGNGSWGCGGRDNGCDCLWIILILLFCCGDGCGFDRFDGCC